VVEGDPCVLTLHVPGGFKVESAETEGHQLETTTKGEVAPARITPAATKTIAWNVRFQKPQRLPQNVREPRRCIDALIVATPGRRARVPRDPDAVGA